MVFCSVSCWEVHLPVANHREAWAIDAKAPTTLEEPDKSAAPKRESRRRVVRDAAQASTVTSAPQEVLIVASRLKDYVRARAGFKTSERVLDPLSDIIRRVCDEAIENARRDGRKTILDRDIPSGR
jgi:histone H3/H4